MILTNENNGLPNNDGFYGEFGGQYVPDDFKIVLNKLDCAFENAIEDKGFISEVLNLMQNYSGRPTPLYFAKNLTHNYGKGKIYLKREDLNFTGSHKINNVLGQGLLAKKMGLKKVIAETGAGQHGVATATVAALLGLECEIFMGEVDIDRQKLNIEKMKLLGAKINCVTKGTKTLKDACDSAIDYYLKNNDKVFYILGSSVGPHPYPKIVRFFQSIIGEEIKKQILDMENQLPNYILACIGGGSNAIGTFYAFLNDKSVKLIGLEASGEGIDSVKTAASLTLGKKCIMHGKMQYVLCDKNGNPRNSYSISAGLDYPGCGPEHCYLKDIKRVNYYPINDIEAVRAYKLLTKLEGIIPAIESSHALAYLEKLMPETKKNEIIIVNLSGRGEKDINRVLKFSDNKKLLKNKQ